MARSRKPLDNTPDEDASVGGSSHESGSASRSSKRRRSSSVDEGAKQRRRSNTPSKLNTSAADGDIEAAEDDPSTQPSYSLGSRHNSRRKSSHKALSPLPPAENEEKVFESEADARRSLNHLSEAQSTQSSPHIPSSTSDGTSDNATSSKTDRRGVATRMVRRKSNAPDKLQSAVSNHQRAPSVDPEGGDSVMEYAEAEAEDSASLGSSSSTAAANSKILQVEEPATNSSIPSIVLPDDEGDVPGDPTNKIISANVSDSEIIPETPPGSAASSSQNDATESTLRATSSAKRTSLPPISKLPTDPIQPSPTPDDHEREVEAIQAPEMSRRSSGRTIIKTEKSDFVDISTIDPVNGERDEVVVATEVLVVGASETEEKKPYIPQLARLPVFIESKETAKDGLYTTADVPMTKIGFTYVPCYPSPNESPNKDLGFYRPVAALPVQPSAVRMSFNDRSNHLRISKDGLTVSAVSGFRSGRANVPIRLGRWYCEVKVLQAGGESGGNVRVGFARRETSLNGPVGLDGHSYGIRDVTGQKITQARLTPYAEKGFGTGDVVGMYICIEPRYKDLSPPKDPASSTSAVEGSEETNKPKREIISDEIVRRRVPISFKNQLYFEVRDAVPSKEMEVLMDPPPPPRTKKSKAGITIKDKTLPSADAMQSATAGIPLRPLEKLEGSKIKFYINGVSPGVAFEDIYDFRPLKSAKSNDSSSKANKLPAKQVSKPELDPIDDGTLGYFPFLSAFGGGKMQFNAGPNFDFPPPRGEGTDEGEWRPLCDRFDEYYEECRVLDERDERVFCDKYKKDEAAKRREARKAARESSPASMSTLPNTTTTNGGSSGDAGNPSTARRKQPNQYTYRNKDNKPLVPSGLGSNTPRSSPSLGSATPQPEDTGATPPILGDDPDAEGEEAEDQVYNSWPSAGGIRELEV